MFDQKCLKEVEKLSLSNNTVSRRIDEISEWVENKLYTVECLKRGAHRGVCPPLPYELIYSVYNYNSCEFNSIYI